MSSWRLARTGGAASTATLCPHPPTGWCALASLTCCSGCSCFSIMPVCRCANASVLILSICTTQIIFVNVMLLRLPVRLQKTAST